MGQSDADVLFAFDSGFIDLLLAVFPTDGQLRTFVLNLAGGSEMEIRLPGPESGASRLRMTAETVRLLQEFERVDIALNTLVEQRPIYRAEIAELRALPRVPKQKPPPPRPQNPAPPLPHVYVERDIGTSLRDAIMGEQRPLVGLTGALGVGKTTLAAAVTQLPQVRPCCTEAGHEGPWTQCPQPSLLFKRYGRSSGVQTPASGSGQRQQGRSRSSRSGPYTTEGYRQSRAYSG
jgi:hypothetical protein